MKNIAVYRGGLVFYKGQARAPVAQSLSFNYQVSWQHPAAIRRAGPELEVGAGGDSWIWQLLILPAE